MKLAPAKHNPKPYVVVQYEGTDREDIFDDFLTFKEAKEFIKTESNYEESLSIMKRLEDGTLTTEF